MSVRANISKRFCGAKHHALGAKPRAHVCILDFALYNCIVSTYDFVLKRTNIKTGKQLLFYLTCVVWMAVYSAATMSITLFLNENFSIFFIGLFMAMTNVISMFADVPIGYFQKLMPQKILLVFSVAAMMLSVIIFIVSAEVLLVSFLAVLVHALAYDIYHITMMSYLLDISSPEEYSQSMSQKNVADALGLLIGLLGASVINFLPFAEHLVFPILLLGSAMVLLFIFTFFDQAEYDTSLDKMGSDAITGKLSPAEMANSIKDFFVSSAITGLNKIEDVAHSLKEKIDKKTVMILKPLKPLETYKKESMIDGIKESFKSLFHIFYPVPQWPLVWSSAVTIFFSMWDTFVTTFMLIFIIEKVVKDNNLSPVLSGVIIAVIAAPLFVCQIPFAKLADKIGKPFFMYFGSAISSVSIAALGFSTDIYWVLLAGIVNSIGYAMAFPAAQGYFAQRFQEHYAKIHNTNEMDTNASVGPLKTLVDFGNVIAQLGGGVLIAIFGFSPTFVIFGFALLLIFVASMVMMPLVLKHILKPNESAVKPADEQGAGSSPITQSPAA